MLYKTEPQGKLPPGSSSESESSSDDSDEVGSSARKARRAKKKAEESLGEDEEEERRRLQLDEKIPSRKGREKMMDLPRAMAALGLKGLRELEDIKTGPIAVSTGFQTRTHYIEEMRSFCLHHEKKQEWYKKLPHDQKTQKNFAAKNKYKRYAKYKTQMTRNELIKIHQAYQTLRARFKDKYPKVPPMATFKGAYGAIATESSKGSKDKEESSRSKAMTTTKDEAERRKKKAEHLAALQKARNDYQVCVDRPTQMFYIWMLSCWPVGALCGC